MSGLLGLGFSRGQGGIERGRIGQAGRLGDGQLHLQAIDLAVNGLDVEHLGTRGIGQVCHGVLRAVDVDGGGGLHGRHGLEPGKGWNTAETWQAAGPLAKGKPRPSCEGRGLNLLLASRSGGWPIAGHPDPDVLRG